MNINDIFFKNNVCKNQKSKLKRKKGVYNQNWTKRKIENICTNNPMVADSIPIKSLNSMSMVVNKISAKNLQCTKENYIRNPHLKFFIWFQLELKKSCLISSETNKTRSGMNR